MSEIIGDPKDRDSYCYLEKVLDRITKLQINDFSLKCARSNLIAVKILRLIKGEWSEIGKANLWVKHRTVEWVEFEIGSDSEFVIPGFIPDSRYKYRKFRNLGIGSKVVSIMIEYLGQNGAKEIYGELSDIDDVQKASNFWIKNGFTIILFEKSSGHIVGKNPSETRFIKKI